MVGFLNGARGQRVLRPAVVKVTRKDLAPALPHNQTMVGIIAMGRTKKLRNVLCADVCLNDFFYKHDK